MDVQALAAEYREKTDKELLRLALIPEQLNPEAIRCAPRANWPVVESIVPHTSTLPAEKSKRARQKTSAAGHARFGYSSGFRAGCGSGRPIAPDDAESRGALSRPLMFIALFCFPPYTHNWDSQGGDGNAGSADASEGISLYLAVTGTSLEGLGLAAAREPDSAAFLHLVNQDQFPSDSVCEARNPGPLVITGPVESETPSDIPLGVALQPVKLDTIIKWPRIGSQGYLRSPPVGDSSSDSLPNQGMLWIRRDSNPHLLA